MNVSSGIYVLRWLIVDTFRQALASRIFWIMLAVSGVFILFCCTVHVTGGIGERKPDDTALFTKDNQPLTSQSQAGTKFSFLFGAITVDAGTRSQEEAVSFLQVMLATTVAGYLGFLLTLLWTAGFLPEFLQASNAAVLFAKPAPRWLLLVGKYLGVVTFVAFQVLLFFGGTWLALSARTGIWQYGYLAGMPLLVVNFAVIYSFAVLIAVLTRSTVASIFGCVLFWALCWATNYGHHWLLAAPELAGAQRRFRAVCRCSWPTPATGFCRSRGTWNGSCRTPCTPTIIAWPSPMPRDSSKPSPPDPSTNWRRWHRRSRLAASCWSSRAGSWNRRIIEMRTA